MALPAHLQAFDRLLDLIAERMGADELAGVPLEIGPDEITPAVPPSKAAGVGVNLEPNATN